MPKLKFPFKNFIKTTLLPLLKIEQHGDGIGNITSLLK